MPIKNAAQMIDEKIKPIQTMVRFPPKLKETLGILAIKQHRSLSNIVIECVTNELPNIKKLQKKG